MLYVFVGNEQCHVYYATYDVKQFRRYKQVELVARYWGDVEIYEVKENYDD